MPKNSLYNRLGLPEDASPEEIRRAYREMARHLHPDTNVAPGETELFLDMQEAYEILSDPDKRAAYDKELAVSPPPVKTRILYSRTMLTRMREPQLVYTLLELQPLLDAKVVSSPPLNICLVLDRSTSMQGVMMDTVKATAIELIRQMRPQDIFSIVAFSDRAEVLIPSGTRMERGAIENKIHLLGTGGGTEIFQGLEAGFSEVYRFHNIDYINHIILLTDGRTYGDERDCLALADRAASLKISISTLGIGSKWQDDFLDKLSSRTGGNSTYVSKPSDIRRYLKEKVGGLGLSYAKHVAFTYELPPNVTLNYAFRIQPETSPFEIGSPLQLGSVPRDTNLSILLEFLIQEIPHDVDQITLCEGRIVGDVLGSSTKNLNLRINLSRPTQNDPEADPPPQEIVTAMSRLTLYRMQERARNEMSEGKVREAARRLQNLATNLLAHGERDLARTVIGEITHVQQNLAFSEEGEKQIKYGTRALLLMPGTKD